jgi:hypothetical protein
MAETRRRTTVVTVGVLAVLVVGTVVVTLLVRHLRGDSVELCGRKFRRSNATWTDQKVRVLGSIHTVGTSPADGSLWTVSSAWPQNRCDGLTPTVLLSRDGDGWRTWTLVGGP